MLFKKIARYDCSGLHKIGLFDSRKGKAPDASAAAALIAIIAALIVLYILFIPPEERQRILEETGDGNGFFDEDDKNILLSESPQRLFPAEDREFEQDFSAVSIQVGQEGIELKRLDSLYVSSSLFSDNQYNVKFNVIDPENVDEALLNFLVLDSQGRLIVELNDNEIFNREVSSGNIDPINIREYLVEGTNILVFSASSPGAAFWRTNEYSLEDVLVTADILRREAQQSTLTFVATEQERENLRRVRLRFLPECEELESGPLAIMINNYELYSAVPDCGVPNRAIEFLPERLVVGENRLTFSTTAGWYLIDNIRLTSEIEETISPVYYFEVSDQEFENVEDDESSATLFMRFSDDEQRKVADVFVNNQALRIDQTEDIYNVSLDNMIVKGTNAIRIEPDEIIDITELRIELES